MPVFPRLLLACAALLCASAVHAQQPSYGPALNLDTAKKLASAAAAEAKKLNINVAIAVVDTHGEQVYFEIFDDTMHASSTLAIDKARTAATYRRPTKVFQDSLKEGASALLSLPGALLFEGGEPVIVNGRLVGAIGVSGGTAPQDGQVARAGLQALK